MGRECPECRFIEDEYAKADSDDLTRDGLLLALAANKVAHNKSIDWYQQRFKAIRKWVDTEVRPRSEEVANRYFAIAANGSPAPHERADWSETMHDLTLRAEQAERQRDSLVAVLACLFGWEDKTYAHAVMHVENAVENLRADFKAAEKTIESLQAQLDLAHKFHDVAVKERDYERRTNNLLGEVLAVLNGDGGQTTRELGWEKSTKRALARFNDMRARLAGCVTYPCDCTYTRDGQPDFNCATCHGLGTVTKTEVT